MASLGTVRTEVGALERAHGGTLYLSEVAALPPPAQGALLRTLVENKFNRVGGTVGFYTYTVYMQKYLVNTVGLSKEASTLTLAGALLVYMLLQPLFGYMSDIFGRRPVLLA